MARALTAVSALETAMLEAVLEQHDRCWGAVDMDGLAALWDLNDPAAMYFGDEYRDPVIGSNELARHWSRLASRLHEADVRSTIASLSPLADELLLAVIGVRWQFGDAGENLRRDGSSWVIATLRRADAGLRFVTYVERLRELGAPAPPRGKARAGQESA
jgi:hypothetical protein